MGWDGGKGVNPPGEPPRQILCSAQRQGLSVPQRHRVSAPQKHRVSVRQRHTVSVPDRPAKKIDFRVESAGVRDETWWKFRAMPGGFWRQKQQTWPSASPPLPSFRSSPLPQTSLRGPRNWEVEERSERRLGGRGRLDRSLCRTASCA